MTTGTIGHRRCRGGALLLPLLALRASSGLVVPVGRAATAFVVVPVAPVALVADAPPADILPSLLGGSSAHSAMTLLSADEGGGGVDVLGTVGGILGATLLLAIAIFATAKITLKPELAEGARKIREEEKTMNILSLVKEQRNGGGDMSVLVEPLEKTLGMTVKEYVSSVDTKSSDSSEDVVDADKELAAVLRTVYL